LGGNYLTLADGKLAAAIAKNESIKRLHIYENIIGGQGVQQLADALKKNNTLQELNLNTNYIRDVGAKYIKYIAEMLAVNTTLQTISLCINSIGDKGAESIATSLSNNTSLHNIYLNNNTISDKGAEKLADALESNHSIKNLYLHNNNISKGMMDRIKATLQDPKRKTLIANNKENEQETKGEDEKARKTTAMERIVLQLEVEVKDQINSALKEKEDAQKLVASMKADITRKEEEIEEKEQEIKSKAGDVAQRDQENERLKKELADAQKKVVTIKQEMDTIVAQKDQQLKSALDGIAKRDTDIANKNKQLDQLHSINRILSLTGNKDEPANKRTRTEDTPNKPKELTLKLGYEHIHCSICASKFSADLDSKDEEIRKFLPVLSASSKTCDHHFCHGCILKQQAAIAEKNRGKVPKWIPCMVCRTITSFCPSEPKYHRLQIDILKQAKWLDAPKVKEEPTD